MQLSAAMVDDMQRHFKIEIDEIFKFDGELSDVDEFQVVISKKEQGVWNPISEFKVENFERGRGIFHLLIEAVQKHVAA